MQAWQQLLRQQLPQLVLQVQVFVQLGLEQREQQQLARELQLAREFALQVLQQNQIRQLRQALRQLQQLNQLVQQFFVIHRQLVMEFQYLLCRWKPLVMAHQLQSDRPLF
jgi:hypothetical protein